MKKGGVLSYRFEASKGVLITEDDISRAMKAAEDMMARDSLERLANVLGPENTQYRVGASGRAARNFIVKQNVKSGGKVWTYIEEGPETEANWYIRNGLQPGELDRQSLSLTTLRKWAALKGITLFNPKEAEEEKKTDTALLDRYTQKDGKVVVRSRFGKVGRKHKKYKPKEVVNNALWAIRSTLTSYGTMGPRNEKHAKGAHWAQLKPKGRGYFNYPYVAFYSGGASSWFTKRFVGKGRAMNKAIQTMWSRRMTTRGKWSVEEWL